MLLPLFPLPTVLFPGALMPLHIFEPRYRALLADVVEADHRFGLLPPGESGDPTPGTVGCIARVRAVQPLPGGRSNIVVSGEERFVLERVVPDERAYLIGQVGSLADEPDTNVPGPADLVALRAMGRRYAEALGALNDVERDAEFAEDTGLLTFQVAALLEWDYQVKRRFLEIRSATERVARLLHAMPALLAGLEARARVHRRASLNGTGPH